jgi:hypothetical protein
MSDLTEREKAIVDWLRRNSAGVWRRRGWRFWQWYGRWVARNAWSVAAKAIERGDPWEDM